MPAKYFQCPVGDRVVLIDQCLALCTNSNGRCLSLPTLYAIGEQRPFVRPSTTQLLKGLRQAYLEIVCDYAINPFDTAFMLLGTRVHKRLDVVAKRIEMLSEQKLDSETMGTLDLIEPDELSTDKFKLIDYKTSGSYAVAKALGMKSDDGSADMREWELQLNKYRIEIERLGFPISRMFIQSIVRDGGTYSARNNGINQNFYMIPVKRLDDIKVSIFFQRRNETLMSHLTNHEIPPMCTYEETWGNRKCKKFCNVAEWCPEGAMMCKIELKQIPNKGVTDNG